MWLSIPRAAEHAGVCDNTIKRWMRDGLKHSRIGSQIVRIKVDNLDAYIEKHAVHTVVDEIEQIRPRVRKLAREILKGM